MYSEGCLVIHLIDQNGSRIRNTGIVSFHTVYQLHEQAICHTIRNISRFDQPACEGWRFVWRGRTGSLPMSHLCTHGSLSSWKNRDIIENKVIISDAISPHQRRVLVRSAGKRRCGNSQCRSAPEINGLSGKRLWINSKGPYISVRETRGNFRVER